MVTPAHADPLAGLHSDEFVSVFQFAERNAFLTASCLAAFVADAQARGETFDHQGWPTGFLLELGALVQLFAWEVSGLRSFLPQDVPTYREAAADLVARVQNNPRQMGKLESAKLSNRVLQLWRERFVWTAPTVLGVDVTLGQVDAGALVAALAPLLWKYRRVASRDTSELTE